MIVLKIPDPSPEQEELFRSYLGIRRALGLGWDTEQRLAAELLAVAAELHLTPRQIEALREYAKTPTRLLEESCRD